MVACWAKRARKASTAAGLAAGAALGDGHWLVRVRVDPERGRTPRLVSKIKDGKFVSPTIFDQYPELPADVEAGYATLKAGL